MAYVKQNWECGQVITADKLNHMEDGIAAGGSTAEPFLMNYTAPTKTATCDGEAHEVQSVRATINSIERIYSVFFDDEMISTPWKYSQLMSEERVGFSIRPMPALYVNVPIEAATTDEVGWNLKENVYGIVEEERAFIVLPTSALDKFEYKCQGVQDAQ